MKAIGWIASVVGAIMAITFGGDYIQYTSESLYAWRYATEIEQCRTFLFVGLVIMAIGVALLIVAYKNSNAHPVTPNRASPMQPKTICPHCSASINIGASFCDRCGSKIERGNGAQNTRFCKFCGAVIADEARFCDACGAKVE